MALTRKIAGENTLRLKVFSHFPLSRESDKTVSNNMPRRPPTASTRRKEEETHHLVASIIRRSADLRRKRGHKKAAQA